MKILQFLLSFFAKEYGDTKFAPVFNALKENSYDINKTLKSINPQILIPFIKEFFNFTQKKSPENTSREGYGLSPISSIADKDVVFVLNKYFGSEENH